MHVSRHKFAFVEALRQIVARDCLLLEPEQLLPYECDALAVHAGMPSAVVLPENCEQVVSIVKLCGAWGVPFVPRGAGTGLSGGALPADGAVILECSRMNRILDVNVEDRYAVIEPGVINADLSKAVASHGLFFAPDPSSQLACSIGGNIAENSGGPHTFKYGATTEHVLALEVVLPDGTLRRFGSPSGFASGFDLAGLLTGSEGTLGVITQAVVRFTERPEQVETLLVVFEELVTACDAVTRILRSGIVPSALEIMDQRTICAIEASVYSGGLPTDAGAVLLVELDGPAPSLARHVQRIQVLMQASGARNVSVARDAQERLGFWRARKSAFGAMGRIAPDVYVHDAVVPRTKLPEVLKKVCEIGDRYRLTLSNVFHAGDGNLHPNISFDRRNADELQRVLAAGEEILRYCVAVGGSISGEHGIGHEKREFLRLLFSDRDLATMEAVRAVFDPAKLCNPSKVLPSTRSCVESNPHLR